MLSFISYIFVIAQTLAVLHVAPEPIDYTVSSKVKAAMKYHGILFSTRDEMTHNSYFTRNGKKCTLFTRAFEKSWERRNK